MVKCDFCSKEFYKRPNRIKSSKNNFCSKECYEKHLGSVLLECPECHKSFKKGLKQIDKVKKGIIFCSKKCQYDNKVKNTIDQFSKKCSDCGKDMIRKEKSKSGLYFCSFECKKSFNNKKGMVKCVVCEKDFYKHPAETKRYPIHCCSVECRAKNNIKQETKECDFCGEKIIKPQSLFKDRKNFFCSEDCHNKWQDKKVEVECDYCKKNFYKQDCLIKRSKSNFCSVKCKSKSMAKISYVENELEDAIKATGIKYERNDRKVVGPLELDFWFPEIKYAIEINGILHYKPIFGKETLIKIKKRDKRKKIKCKELGIKLRVVKPGNSRDGTRKNRFDRVILELKQRAKEFVYNGKDEDSAFD